MLTAAGFYINLPPGGIVVCTLLSLAIPEQIKKQPVRGNLKNIVTEELDLIGFVLFAPACIMFLLAMTWGGTEYRWDSSVIIGLFCGSFVTSVVFATWEYFRGEKAMIPPSIAGKRLVMFGGCTSFLQVGALLLLSYYLPLWFQVVKDDSPIMSGVMVLPTAISQAIAGITAGKLGKRYPTALSRQTLTERSPGHWLLHTVGPSRMYLFFRRFGIDDNVHGFQWRRCLDWVSDTGRCRKGDCCPDGMYGPLRRSSCIFA
jgi:hypothetical protein